MPRAHAARGTQRAVEGIGRRAAFICGHRWPHAKVILQSRGKVAFRAVANREDAGDAAVVGGRVVRAALRLVVVKRVHQYAMATAPVQKSGVMLNHSEQLVGGSARSRAVRGNKRRPPAEPGEVTDHDTFPASLLPVSSSPPPPPNAHCHTLPRPPCSPSQAHVICHVRHRDKWRWRLSQQLREDYAMHDMFSSLSVTKMARIRMACGNGMAEQCMAAAGAKEAGE